MRRSRSSLHRNRSKPSSLSCVSSPVSRSPKPRRYWTSRRQPPNATGLLRACGSTASSKARDLITQSQKNQRPREGVEGHYSHCSLSAGRAPVDDGTGTTVMATSESPAELIFFTALEKGSQEERERYMTEACGGDTELRQRVERMLNAHPKVGTFLESAVTGLGSRADFDRPAVLL